MRLVSVVTSTRSSLATRSVDLRQHVVDLRATPGARSTSGSTRPVGPHHLLDHLRRRAAARSRPGVAETKIVCAHHASRTPRTCSGRLSSADGRRKPYSTSVLLARAVALVHARRAAGSVTWLSSTTSSASVRQVVEQRRRRLARLRAGQVARVVLDALAVADLGHHLEVEAWCAARGAAPRPACPAPAKLLEPLAQLDLDRLDRAAARCSRGVT